jgi:hypothetical protein
LERFVRLIALVGLMLFLLVMIVHTDRRISALTDIVRDTHVKESSYSHVQCSAASDAALQHAELAISDADEQLLELRATLSMRRRLLRGRAGF